MLNALPLPRTLTLALLALGLAGPALAQYKTVGPDGKVTYSDQPAAGAAGGRPPVATPADDSASLPLALRQPMARYPVTLYAARGCKSCDAGRQWLQQRGIPFAEKRVESAADIAAYQRLSNATTLPLLTIGAQKLTGFASGEWQSYLDAAGYPRESRLPASWRNPAPVSLAPASAPPAPAVRSGADEPTPEAAPSTPAVDPTAPRIRF